jgi:hypothetical protein
MQQVIRESRGNVKYEYDANQANKHSMAIAQNFQRRKGSFYMDWGSALAIGSLKSCIGALLMTKD